MAVSFDLFGTLVTVERPDNPAVAVATELESRGVSVPDDFADAYGETHIDAPEGAEVPLPAHVGAALRSRGVVARNNAAREAVVAAFDPEVTRRAGAKEAIEAVSEHGSVGLCSNCSVPELVGRALVRSDLYGRFDAIVTSSGCGWRKPDRRIFEATATALDIEPESLVHVGDDPAADGGITAIGGRYVDVAGTPLSAIARNPESLWAGSLESEP